MFNSILNSKSKEVVYEDILERRKSGQSINEIANEYAYLSITEIGNIIAEIEQAQFHE